MQNYSIEKIGPNWNFKSEAELEDFIYSNLTEIFDLIPLRRQYYIQGLYSDLIATNLQKQLVIIELKITKDRYIVQQLTRYYDYIKNDDNLRDEIDFNLPINLFL